jgi:hypothetical protein
VVAGYSAKIIRSMNGLKRRFPVFGDYAEIFPVLGKKHIGKRKKKPLNIVQKLLKTKAYILKILFWKNFDMHVVLSCYPCYPFKLTNCFN